MVTEEQRERLLELLRRLYEVQYTVQVLNLDYLQIVAEIEGQLEPRDFDLFDTEEDGNERLF